jgi:hypothetical protein
MLYIIYRHGGHFSLLDRSEETAKMIAIFLGNTEAVKEILNYSDINIFSTNRPTTREETATTTTTEPQPGLCRTVLLESSA